jgi:hypothetical protein
MRIRSLALAAALSGLLAAGCSRREPPAPATQPAPLSAPAAEPAAPTTSPSPVAKEETSAATEPAAAPAAEPVPAATTQPPAAPPKLAERMPVPHGPAPATNGEPAAAPAATPAAEIHAPKVDDPGGTIAVASTNPRASRIGAEKCKLCHKLQYASWAETAHARRTPPLECESCHGPGSEYKTLSVMKDPARARAAGLVIPDASFCATCHKRDWKSDMLSRAHAHKAKPAP